MYENVTREWKPHKVQEEFIKIPPTVFEALYGGAAGGGKSELLLMLPIIYRFHEHPQYQGIIFRKTCPELEKSLIPRSFPFYEPFGGKFNASKYCWTFPSGAKQFLSHLQDERAARGHDTVEYNYMAFDELTAFEDFLYIFLTSRVRSSCKDLPFIVRSATNPGNIGHAWVKSRFVDPCPEGRKLLVDKVSNTRRIFIPAKLNDNPYLLASDPGYGDRLKLLPENEQKAKLEGSWDIFEGQAFTEFREFKIPTEPENAIHVVDPSIIPAYYPRILTVDWGQAAMTSGLWGALTPGGKVIIYREYAEKFKDTAQWATDIGNLSLRDNLVYASLDPSAWQDRGDPETIAKRAIQFSGINFRPANNDRVSGKLLIHEYLRWKPKPPRVIPIEGYKSDLAARILMQRGKRDFDDYLSLFKEELPETNLPKLLISKECPTLIKTIKRCIIDPKKPNDVKEFEGDDPYDNLRYLLKVAESYYSGLLEEFKVRNELSKILDDYDKTKDYLTFDNRMARLEKGQSNAPIRIGHHTRGILNPAKGSSGIFKRRTY